MNRKQTNTMDGLCVELDDENKNEKKTGWSNEYLVIEVIADCFFPMMTTTTIDDFDDFDWLIDWWQIKRRRKNQLSLLLLCNKIKLYVKYEYWIISGECVSVYNESMCDEYWMTINERIN